MNLILCYCRHSVFQSKNQCACQHTVFFHQPYSKHKLSRTAVSLQFRPNATSAQSWKCLTGVGEEQDMLHLEFLTWTSRFSLNPPTLSLVFYHLVPTLFSTKPALISIAPPAVLPYTSPYKYHTLNLLHCSNLPPLSISSGLVELCSLAEGHTVEQLREAGSLCLSPELSALTYFCVEWASSIFQASLLTSVESGKNI